MKPEAFRLKRDAYPYFRPVIARFSDMDAEGHLNNVALASFYEDGRVSFLRDLTGGRDRQQFRFAIANLDISYLAEAHYPGDYDVGLGFTKIGNTSFALGCALFRGEVCVGTCDTIQVVMGNAGPIAVPHALRDALLTKSIRRA